MNSIIITCLMAVSISCGNGSPQNDGVTKSNSRIVNFDNQVDINMIRKLNLDSLYPNLLDPSNSSEAEYKIVIKSWGNFHQKVTKFMKEEDFTWSVEDSTISIVNKVYFNKNGTIDYFVFKVMNPSISDSKKREFESVLQKFSGSITMDLTRDSKYAQCGKTRYINY